MVYLNQQSLNDLEKIREGFLTWKKFELSEAFIIGYVNQIIDVCYSLDLKSFHFNNKFSKYKKYGAKLHTYKRNKQTQWYIIYNIDRHGNIFINHISSNHTTNR